MSKYDYAMDYGRELARLIRELEHRMHMTDMSLYEVKEELVSIMATEEFEYFDNDPQDEED